jgi:hypothetical protein
MSLVCTTLDPMPRCFYSGLLLLHYLTFTPSGESSVGGSSSPRSDHSTTAAIIRSGHLPQPELGNIPDIERAIKTLVRGQAIRERICEYIQREVRRQITKFFTVDR